MDVLKEPSGTYSPEYLEGLFSEVRISGFLRSSLPLVYAHRTQRYTLWMGQLVAQIAYSEGMGDG